MKILAPAKVNLYLEVLRRRADGYHSIESVMQTVSLADRITLEARADKLSFECDLPGLPVDERNLAFRAAVRLKEILGVTKGAHIVLEKRVPLGAGLGGGSSDAAAVLRGLLRLWKKRIEHKKLYALAASLGADVPFFLKGGTCIARGIGEKLEPVPGVDLRKAYFILVYPGFPVATPWVYQNLRFPLTNKQKITTMRKLLVSGSSPDEWGARFFNRLEEVVLPAYPGICQIKETLERYGVASLMSGSGSTVFGLCTSLRKANDIVRQLARRDWKVFLGRALPPWEE